MSAIRPVKILIAAMGGEGGGVLMDWIVGACWALDYPVQATSVPGVAQRTGATTYYIEMLPERRSPADKRPIFALTPTAGEVDLLVATELAEAARAIGAGLVTKDRTTLIAANHRVYATDEKVVLGDGRVDPAKLRKIVEGGAKTALVFDAAAAARDANTVINAVMLGAIAATGILKIDAQQFVAAIAAEGKAVASNLAGFKLGFAAKTEVEVALVPTEPDVVAIGVDRLTDYQDASYAQLYCDRLSPFAEGDPTLFTEIARHLALRMSYEDIIRVAQAKIRQQRFDRIRVEASAKDGDLIDITEFFKPGFAEFADLLPPAMGAGLLAWAERRGHMKRGWAMHVRSTTVTGFLKIWLLAHLRWWRRHSYRYAVEQRGIESWLALVAAAVKIDVMLAREVCELARLIKGYGSTHRRGSANYARIVEALVRPALADPARHPKAAPRIATARNAALKDPDGVALGLALAVVEPALKHAAE